MAEAYICRRGGGGGRRVPVTLRGAPYTVVTCVPAEGGEAQSFALNGAGDAEITLKTGSYTFSNLLSLETGEAETAIYTVSAAVGRRPPKCGSTRRALSIGTDEPSRTRCWAGAGRCGAT